MIDQSFVDKYTAKKKEWEMTVVQGAMILVATTFVLVNLLTDLAYVFFDPRIRYE